MEELNFEIQIGGENIIDNIKPTIAGDNPIIPSESMKNWELCKHRSELTTYWVRSSCGCQPGSNVEGRICKKLQIQGINPAICAACSSFEIKE